MTKHKKKKKKTQKVFKGLPPMTDVEHEQRDGINELAAAIADLI